MSAVIRALEVARERLLLATLAFREGDEERGCDEMRSAADALQVAVDSLVAEQAAA